MQIIFISLKFKEHQMRLYEMEVAPFHKEAGQCLPLERSSSASCQWPFRVTFLEEGGK